MLTLTVLTQAVVHIGVETAAVQQWKKEGTGIWARRDCSKVQLKTYLILRDMEMRRIPDLHQTVQGLHTEMLKEMVTTAHCCRLLSH